MAHFAPEQWLTFAGIITQEISLEIDAQNVTDTCGLFLLFYKWIIKDNLFLSTWDDKKSFEDYHIHEFKVFFINYNDRCEELLPSDKILKLFLWEVLLNGFNKHLGHIKKLYPDI